MPFVLNFYSTPLLMGFIQGIIYAILLFKRGYQEAKLADKLLAALLILICLHIAQYMLGFAGWYDSNDGYSTFMFYFPFHNVLWMGPILYFYFRSLTNDNFRFGKQAFWHFLPGFLYLLYMLSTFIVDIGITQWMNQEILPGHSGTQGDWSCFRQQKVENALGNLNIISFVIYLVLTTSIYRQYRQYINDNYSDTEQIQFNWIRNILYIVIAAFIFDFLIDISGNFIEYTDYTGKWNSYLGFAIMIYAISILGYNQTGNIIQKLDFVPNETTEPIETTPELEQYKSRLLSLMKEQQLFLQSDLTLKDTATKLKTNSNILSKVINTGFGQNFNDFVNSFRVEAVKEKIQNREMQHLTLTAIAYECGFNSKATFNRAFKKFTTMSPREFMQQKGK